MKDMMKHFVKRGYPVRILKEAKDKVDRLSRKRLLSDDNRKDKKADSEEDRIKFPITYHPVNAKISSVVKNNFESLKEDDDIGALFEKRPMVVHRRGTNLRDMLVRSRLRSDDVDSGTKKCGNRRCLTCDFICEDKVVVGPKSSFEVRCKFTCNSTGLVYCIVCNKCGELYVGETGRALKERFREHRLSVINKEDKEVAHHFNSQGHDVKDMSILGLVYKDGLVSRRLQEQKIIAKLGCFLGRGMNTDFKFAALINDI